MPKLLNVVLVLLLPTALILLAAGCGDDIRTTKTIETEQQEPVQMVSPGEPIVE